MNNFNFSILALYFLFVAVRCQIPSFAGCPVYQPMLEFNKERFMGTWYEAERYFTVTELASRCISATYARRHDDLIWVNNSITNRFTGVKRNISGKMKLIGKSGEGKYSIEYTTSLPVNCDTTLNVLDTDYTTFAVIWSCNGIGPVGHTESAWLMTRDRLPHDLVMQRAYGVLDKFQISRSFFIKTDQKNCEDTAPTKDAHHPIKPSTVHTASPVTEKKKTPDAANKVKEKSDILLLNKAVSNVTVVASDRQVEKNVSD